MGGGWLDVGDLGGGVVAWMVRRTGQRGFVKRLIAIWKATFKARSGGEQGLLMLMFLLLCSGFIAFGSIAAGPPVPVSLATASPRSECLSLATAIEEFHFETFNLQRATLFEGPGDWINGRGAVRDSRKRIWGRLLFPLSQDLSRSRLLNICFHLQCKV